jgi:hypothetical protein
MANYRRTATGNWSTLAQWEVFNSPNWVAAIALPTVGDVVQANGFTCTLDIDCAVSEFRNSAGGFFTFGAATTVIGNCYNGTLAGGVVRNTTSGTKFFIGDSYAGAGSQVHGILNSGAGIVIQTGNSYGGTGAIFGGNANAGIANTSTGSVIINGNVFGNGGGNCGACNFATATGTITVNGSAQNGSGFGNLANVTNFVHTIVGSSLIVNAGLVEIVHSQTVLSSIRFRPDGYSTSYILDGSPIILTAAPNYPAEADVRDNITFGPANMYTGTLETGATAQQIWDFLLTNITVNDSIGKLIKDNLELEI